MGNAVGCISAGATEGVGAMGCAEGVSTGRAEGVGVRQAPQRRRHGALEVALALQQLLSGGD